MKTKNIFRLFLFVLIAGMIIYCPVFAQEKAGDKKADESKKDSGKDTGDLKDPDNYKLQTDNYLERFYARDIVEKLMSENLEKIYMLKIVVTNFKDRGWKPDYEKVYEEYKKGVSFFYKREMLKSKMILETNRVTISTLFKKMSDEYRKDTYNMLDICANTILIISINKNTRYDAEKNRQLMNNMSRLRIAYGEIDRALENRIDQNYQFAIFHYRVAKSYAILIMEDLLKEDMVKKEDTEPEDYDKIQKLMSQKKDFNLANHKADNQNKIQDDKSVSEKKEEKAEEKKGGK
jgi:hypothetical protein